MRREDERWRGGSRTERDRGIQREWDRGDTKKGRLLNSPLSPNTSLISLECSDRSIYFHLHINRFLLIIARAACVAENLLNISRLTITMQLACKK